MWVIKFSGPTFLAHHRQCYTTVSNAPHALSYSASFRMISTYNNKKHLKNVGPIHYCEPPHAHSPDVASGTVARRLRIDVHDNDDNDNA